MQEWLLSLPHFRLLYAHAVVCPCLLKTHDPLLTHSRCEPFPLISRHVCLLRGNNPTPTALTMDLESMWGRNWHFLSPFLNAWYLWYISLFNTYLTQFVRIVLPPHPSVFYVWNGENHLCVEYWSKFSWLISKMGRDHLIIFFLWPVKCSKAQHWANTLWALTTYFPPFI